jgi:hypothetical protein
MEWMRCMLTRDQQTVLLNKVTGERLLTVHLTLCFMPAVRSISCTFRRFIHGDVNCLHQILQRRITEDHISKPECKVRNL